MELLAETVGESDAEIGQGDSRSSLRCGARWDRKLVLACSLGGLSLLLFCLCASSATEPRYSDALTSRQEAQQVKQQEFTSQSSADYVLHRTGLRCPYKRGFMWSGKDADCQAHCDRVPGCNYYTIFPDGWCQLNNFCLKTYRHKAVFGAVEIQIFAKRAITRVLFVGDSLMYVQDLPAQLINIAASLGRNVEIAQSAKLGCTLYAQLLRTVRSPVHALLDLSWDFIILQEMSLLPAVRSLRDVYFHPAVAEFARRKKMAKLVLYMPEAYRYGNPNFCRAPAKHQEKWPMGDINTITKPFCGDAAANHINSFACMTYAMAQGYYSAARREGADLVVPAGLAWLAAQGVSSIPETCRAAIDAEYTEPHELVLLPAHPELTSIRMYIAEHSATPVHPTRVAQYLNALVLYASLFESPIGSTAQPVCWRKCMGDYWKGEKEGPVQPPLSPYILEQLQSLATDAAVNFRYVAEREMETATGSIVDVDSSWQASLQAGTQNQFWN